MATAQEVYDIVMAMADEIDPNGVVNASSTEDFLVRAPGILTSIQSTLLDKGRYTKTHKVTCVRPKASVSGFEPLEYDGIDEKTKEGNAPVYGYNFTATAVGTVYIEDYNGVWNTLDTITTVADTTYKASVTPTSGATRCRIRLAGTYSFAILNYALYRQPYNVVPDWAPSVLVEMPSDYNTVDEITSEEGDLYTQNKPYTFEENNQLYRDINFEGVLRVTYFPNPTTITALTDTIVLNERVAKSVMAYMLGMEFYKEQNDILYNHFKRMYSESYGMIKNPKKSNNTTVYDEYGGF